MCEEISRYSIISEKNPREIVLLKGKGCFWKKCSFCDYHLDCSSDEDANYKFNRDILDNVTGQFSRLEVINSGSYFELDENTKRHIKNLCKEKNIKNLHFESHFAYFKKVDKVKEEFAKEGINLFFKLGLETFDVEFRESVLNKGFSEEKPDFIAKYFDEVCLLFGIEGQNYASMMNDIELGLKYFNRICINIMIKNTTKILPSKQVIEVFMNEIYPKYINDPRVDILVDNCDFGVGGSLND